MQTLGFHFPHLALHSEPIKLILKHNKDVIIFISLSHSKTLDCYSLVKCIRQCLCSLSGDEEAKKI